MDFGLFLSARKYAKPKMYKEHCAAKLKIAMHAGKRQRPFARKTVKRPRNTLLWTKQASFYLVINIFTFYLNGN